MVLHHAENSGVPESDVRKGWTLPFFIIWTGQAFSLLGSALVQFALVWWLTESTGSATVLALATLVAMLPNVVLGPVAGALVDRWNRRVVMIGADAAVAIATGGLAVLFAADLVQTWHVYVALLVRAAGGTFHWPAMQASTTLMVPARHLARVAGLNQALNGAMTIVAPPLGALLLMGLPVQGVLAIDIGTALLAIACLAVIAVPQPVVTALNVDGGIVGTVRADLLDGLRYVWGWPGLRVLLFMAMAINFCIYPAFSLLPILITEHFGGEAAELGWIQSAWGAGIVVGGLFLSAWGGFKRRIVTSMVGLFGMGLGFVLVGLAPGGWLVMALAAMALAGSMNPIHGGPLFAALQATVAPEMQGRVLSLIGAATNVIVPVSLAIAGPLSDSVGPNWWYVVGGGMCIVLAGAAFGIRPLMQLEDQREADAGGGAEPSPISA